MTKSKQLSTVAQGQAGVHRVLSELILLGHRPYIPSSDTGIDILLEHGVRIQVKSTMRASAHWRLKEGTFLFSLSKAAQVRGGKIVVAMPPRIFSAVCDFVVLWAIEPDRFWVVPSGVLDRRHTITISTTSQWRDIDGDRITALKAQGLSVAEIAAQTGISRETIKRRLTTFQTPKRKYSVLPQYENRWDLIAGTVATLSEASLAVEDVPKPIDKESV